MVGEEGMKMGRREGLKRGSKGVILTVINNDGFYSVNQQEKKG